jgi:Zn-dependent protease with chaperone function
MSVFSFGRAGLTLLLASQLAACVVPNAAPTAAPAPIAEPATGPTIPRTKAEIQAANFISVADRVEPVAEALCRRTPGPRNCDYTIAVDSRTSLPPNAYFTLDERGRPFVVFTVSLIAMARNPDELAFVMGHEAGHHIADHIPRRLSEARSGAILAGVIAEAAGLSGEEVRQAQGAGAEIGARRYSREFELEADALGAEIAFLAGYDAVLGAGFFDRLPDPGDKFLGTHPPNRERQSVVRNTVRQLSGS